MAEARSNGRPVDLLFDARHVRQSGIGTYIRTQLPHLEEAAARHRISLAVLGDSRHPARAAPEHPVSSSRLQPSAAMYSPGEQLVWRRAFAESRPRAVWLPHYPHPLARLLPGNRRMLIYVTVHDTTHLLPWSVSGQSWARRMYARAMLVADARSCRRIFTPSEATAATLKEIVPSARAMVTPIPVDESWFEPVDPRLSPISGPYLLYVGNSKRYKNLPLLLEAFSDIADTIPHKLVIAGGGASLRTFDERVRRIAEDNQERIVLTGQLDFDGVACAGRVDGPVDHAVPARRRGIAAVGGHGFAHGCAVVGHPGAAGDVRRRRRLLRPPRPRRVGESVAFLLHGRCGAGRSGGAGLRPCGATAAAYPCERRSRRDM